MQSLDRALSACLAAACGRMDLASHELRSPLTALSSTAQMLQRRLRQDPDRAADLADVNHMLYQIERLSNQLDVLLAATHLAEHRFELTPVECGPVADLPWVGRLWRTQMWAWALLRRRRWPSSSWR